MNRTRPASWIAGIGLWVGIVACAGGRPQPHEGLREMWHDYAKLARHRAIAIAGEPDGAWVGGAVGGFETPRAAKLAALEKCAERRRDRRFQVPCRLYAIDERIVW